MSPVRRILVASDFSRDSRRVALYAGDLARQLDADLLVLHVDERLGFVPGSDLAKQEAAADEADLTRIVEELCSRGVRARGRILGGEPAAEIIAAARTETVDLIVVGTHGRSALAHVLLGSVAERVLRTAGCPVLTVRHPDAADR